ncbi:hypothetical protein, partial [Bacillus sp. Marseille-Q3570]|uniref:hypothetical protein n=1 Tax=Bacillus sp. Marseille-Q3570 TaxID=2963522 RepID=UPI0021B6FAE1
IITGYAIFQALANGNTVLQLIAINHEGKLDKFTVYNLYFYGLSIFFLFIIILNFILLFTFKYIPSNWSLKFISKGTNEYISASLITFYLIININFLIEVKCFIYNLFQTFITNASSASIDYLSKKEDNQEKNNLRES